MYPNCTNLSYNEIFARNVKARREAMGLTRKELAENHMGYREELLAHVEAGDTTGCTIDFLVCLAEYLEAPLEALMTSRYFCPYYVQNPTQPDSSQEPEAAEKRYRLYVVSAGFVSGEGDKAYHSMEMIAQSEEEAIAAAIFRDKRDGKFHPDCRYSARHCPSVLDEKGE